MIKFTKKYMVEDYERLRKHADLLDLYLYDTQLGHKPDAEETQGQGVNTVHAQLWRAASASGGYVVIREVMPNIWYLDDAVRQYEQNHSEHTLGIRICLERLTVRRNQIASQK